MKSIRDGQTLSLLVASFEFCRIRPDCRLGELGRCRKAVREDSRDFAVISRDDLKEDGKVIGDRAEVGSRESNTGDRCNRRSAMMDLVSLARLNSILPPNPKS
jgi:hypothetical protein